MKLLMIRHGLTAGNLEKRYIGTTDEPLCEAGIRQLRSCSYPMCGVLLTSPMQRCIQTAAILFPGQAAQIVPDFRECDFGDFEGKSYAELNGNPQYQAWIDSGGTATFPHGETPAAFRQRCCDAFSAAMKQYTGAESICMVVHGGTIMSVLAEFALPQRSYFDWMTENAHARSCEFDGRNIRFSEKL